MKVSEGSAALAEALHENVLPLPLEHTGPCEIRLRGATGDFLVLTGSGASLQLLDDGVYIEEFPGHVRP